MPNGAAGWNASLVTNLINTCNSVGFNPGIWRGKRMIGENTPQLHRSCQLSLLDFEHIKLPAKLLDYFLRNNKSNINQIAPCDFWVRISPTHLRTDLLEQRPNIDAEECPQIIISEQSNEQKLRHNTITMCHKEWFVVTDSLSFFLGCQYYECSCLL